MQAKDLRSKTIDELKKDLLDQKKEIEKHMIEVYKGKEKNLAKTGLMRKDLARISTVIAEKKFLEKANNA